MSRDSVTVLVIILWYALMIALVRKGVARSGARGGAATEPPIDELEAFRSRPQPMRARRRPNGQH